MFNLSPLQKAQDTPNHIFHPDKDRLPQGHISNYIFQKSPSPLLFRNNIFPAHQGFIAPKQVRKDSLDLDFKSPLIRPYHLESHHTEDKQEFLIPKTPSESFKFNTNDKLSNRIITPAHDYFKLDKEHSETKDKLSSYFLDVLPKVIDSKWELILTKKEKLVEFSNSSNLQKNIDNLIYLENNEDMKLKEIFMKSYENIFEKLKSHPEDFNKNEDLIKALMDLGLKMIFDVHQLIQSCTSDYCLDILKKKTSKKVKTDDTLDPKKTIIIPNPPENSNQKASFQVKELSTQIMNQETLEALSRNLDFNLRRKPKNPPTIFVESMNMGSSPEENVQTKSKRGWSEQELMKLESLSNSYSPNPIPTSVLEDFSKTLGRSLNSVQSKLNKVKKKVSETNPQSQTNNKQNSKLLFTKFIEQALIQLSPNPATKDQIVKKIREMVYLNSYGISDETFQNSVPILLSTQSCFTKIKGTYKLKSPEYVLTNLKDTDTMKLKLRYVLSQFPDYKANIADIKEKFESIFPEIVGNDKEKLYSLTKILNQSEEFDATDSKTKYCLLPKLSEDS